MSVYCIAVGGPNNFHLVLCESLTDMWDKYDTWIEYYKSLGIEGNHVKAFTLYWNMRVQVLYPVKG